MASSGSFSGSIHSGHYTLKVDWTQVQNVSANTSAVTYKIYLIHDWALKISARSNNTYNFGGLTGTYSSPAIDKGSGTTLLSTITKTHSHNADGTLSFSASTVFKIQATLQTTYYENMTASGTVNLNTIPRASTPRLSTASQALRSAITIYTDRASTAFTHTVKYKFGNKSGTIATGVTDSTSWTLPANLAEEISTALNGAGTITLETYNGSTLIGTKSVGFTATVPDNSTFQPNASITSVTEGASSLSAFSVFIQSKSRLRVQSSGSGEYGATIVEYSTTIDGRTYLGADVTSNIIYKSGTIPITVTVKDSRGLKTTVATSATTLEPYTAPKILGFSAKRAPTDTGTDLSASVNFSISTVSNQNTKFYRVRYRLIGGTWVTLIESNGYYARNTTRRSAGVLNANDSYEVELYVADYFTSIVRTVNVSTAFTLVDFRETGRGMAIGKVSESDSFEVGMPTTIFTTEADILKLKRSSPSANVNLLFENDVQTRYISFKDTGRPAWSDDPSVSSTGYDFWTEENSDVITDSGTNPNGSYIRFSDGTQICYSASLPSSNNDTTGTTVTFPASFYDSSYVINASARGIASSTAGSSHVVETQAVSSSTCRIKIMVHTPTTITGTGTPNFGYIAIGRWK